MIEPGDQPLAASVRSRRPSLLGWFAGNPVAANLLMILIFLGGGITLTEIDRQAYPRLAPEEIQISAEYPGAGPSEVEESVCIPIEESIHDLAGIKRLSTQAREGKCAIEVFVLQGHDLPVLASHIRARTQALRTLPKAVERVEIDDTSWEYPAISVVLMGETDRLTLHRLAEEVRDDLGRLPGVRNAKLWSEAKYEIAVEISAERLRQIGLSIGEVAAAIRGRSVDLPGGVVKAPTGEFQLRVKSTAFEKAALLNLSLGTRPDGTSIRLGDVAAVTDGFVDMNVENRSNGRPSETIGVIAVNDLVETAETVKGFVDTLATRLPEGIDVAIRRDNARSFAELLDTLALEGISGFFLVLAVLMLFLSTRVALWAAVGVMISVFGALWWMPAAGVTLNMLSLFGFVLAMGVLVDDAIIVSERIHELQTQGFSGLAGAIRGVREVAVPVVLGVLISLIAFLPGWFVPPSWATRFMKPVAVVMIFALAFSLVEALLILPAHLAQPPKSPAHPGLLERLRGRLNGGLERLRNRGYVPLLKLALAWRYVCVALFAGALGIGWALVEADYVKISLEEDVGYDNFHVHLQPPSGTPYAETRARVDQFLDALHQAEAALNKTQPPGSPSVIEGLDVFLQEADPTIWVEFSSEARRRYHIRDLIQEWYRRVGDIGDFRPDFHTPTEQDVVDLEVELASGDPAVLDGAATEVKNKLGQYPGIAEIKDSRRPGKPEIRFRLTPAGERLGVRVRDIAEQVRQAYHGEEVQRFIRGREEVRIMVRQPLAERQSLSDLKALPIRLPEGGEAPLAALAEVSFTPGFGALIREDRRGIVSIQARFLETAPVKGADVFNELEHGFFEDLQNRYASLDISGGSAKEEAEQVAQGLKRNTLIALAAIYLLIAVSFRSYLQPLLFMLAVPLSWLGALLIHAAMGLTINFQSLVGMIAASGVVVNDSIVLLDFIRRRGESGENPVELILAACTSRFRPIILVAMTNLAGFFPMLFETSEQAKFLVPVTLALSFGLLFGMVATLVLVPVCYAVLEDFRVLSQRLWQRR